MLSEGSLHAWFGKSKSKGGKPGWVQSDGSPCANEPGETKTPKCYSSRRLAGLKKTKEGKAKIRSADARKSRQDPGQQSKSGGAKPTMVRTFKDKKDYKKHPSGDYHKHEQVEILDAYGEPIAVIQDVIKPEPMKSEVDPKDFGYDIETVTEAEKDIKGSGSGKKDACYHKVKSRFKVWPSAYGSGALVKCRKAGAANWGNKSKNEEFSDWREEIGLSEGTGTALKLAVKAAAKPALKAITRKGIQMGGKTGGKLAKAGAEAAGRSAMKAGEKAAKAGVERAGEAATNYVRNIGKKPTNEGFSNWRDELDEACWKGYTKKGMKTMFGKKYPNCVKKEELEMGEEMSIDRRQKAASIGVKPETTHRDRFTAMKLASGEEKPVRGSGNKAAKRAAALKNEEADMSGAPSIKDAKPKKETKVKYDKKMGVMAPQVKEAVGGISDEALEKAAAATLKRHKEQGYKVPGTGAMDDVRARIKAKREAQVDEATYPSDFRNPDGSKRAVAAKKCGRPQQHDQEMSGGRRKTVDEQMGGSQSPLGPREEGKRKEKGKKKPQALRQARERRSAYFRELRQKGYMKNESTDLKQEAQPLQPSDIRSMGEAIKQVQEAAWTKKEGKNPEGGLNEKGRKSYERENPGSDLKAPQPEGGPRKKSFCARMGGMKKKLTSAKTKNDPDSRINKALRKWKC